MMLNELVCLKRNQQIISATIENELVLVDPIEGKFFSLNITASSIWHFLWKQRKIKEIIDKINKEFDVSPSRAKKDTFDAIGDFLKNRLLIKVGPR